VHLLVCSDRWIRQFQSLKGHRKFEGLLAAGRCNPSCKLLITFVNDVVSSGACKKRVFAWLPKSGRTATSNRKKHLKPVLKQMKILCTSSKSYLVSGRHYTLLVLLVCFSNVQDVISHVGVPLYWYLTGFHMNCPRHATLRDYAHRTDVSGPQVARSCKTLRLDVRMMFAEALSAHWDGCSRILIPIAVGFTHRFSFSHGNSGAYTRWARRE
jgi:hypothetical protein